MITDSLYLRVLNSPEMVIGPYLADRLRAADAEVQQVYCEQIAAQELDDVQQSILEHVFIILGEEKIRGYASQTQFWAMHLLHEAKAWERFDYDDLKELLDSFGLKISGRLSQIYALATEITPWCIEHRVTVAGQKVDVFFFARFIEGKCLVSRARGVIGKLRAIVNDATLTDQKKRGLVEAVIRDLVDASVTHEVLRERHSLDAPDEFDIRVYTNNGLVRLDVELTAEQFEYIRKKTGSVVRYQFYT